MLPKPSGCAGCALEFKGVGFVPPVGPSSSPLAFIGESAGQVEAYTGLPFQGPAGTVLNKLLRRSGLDRDAQRIHNVVSCRPPGDELTNKPWEAEAVAKCRQYLEPVLNEPHQVFIALGVQPTRALLGLPKRKHRQNDWHGCPSEWNGKIVVPTFHPAFLLKGRSPQLVGTVLFDLKVAKLVQQGKWNVDTPELVIDPPLEWFMAWAEDHLEAVRSGKDTWLSVDTETLEKLTGKPEDELEMVGEGLILRINFSNNVNLGITVPFSGGYIEVAKRLLTAPGVKVFWHERFDIQMLRVAGIQVTGPVYDGMWMWHVLQSDLPRGLGFAATFFSTAGAWKHLANEEPGRYAALDAVQALRSAFGISALLVKEGMWDAFYRHVYLMDTYVLHPAERVGMPIDKTQLIGEEGAAEDDFDRRGFQGKLAKEQRRIRETLQALVPEELKPEKVWKRDPGPDAAVLSPNTGRPLPVVRVTRREVVGCCDSCGAEEVLQRHRCRDHLLTPAVRDREAGVERWVRREEFNPASPTQVLGYIAHRGHQAGRAKGQEAPSSNKETLRRLAKSTKDPFYQLVLDDRAVGKVKGTYVDGTARRLDSQSRIHTEFNHAPSTMRLSSSNPNVQNVVADRDGAESLAAGFRRCVVAAPGYSLVEADFSGIEAVEVGWLSGDPDYIRLARLGVHAFLASHLLGKPLDLRRPDAELEEEVKRIKAEHDQVYQRAKRCVHGVSYGLTPIGMVNNYPEHFTRATALKTVETFFRVCPKLQGWQNKVRALAAKHDYAGGSEHPFHYRHWYWNLYTYDRKKDAFGLGDDSKRVVAFWPQSIAYGVLAEACLRLYIPGGENYVGDMNNGETPLRALIHDSQLAEVLDEKRDEFIRRIVIEMERPILQQPCPEEWNVGEYAIGPDGVRRRYLQVGVEVKVGKNWAPFNDDLEKGPLNLDGMKKVKTTAGVSYDTTVHDPEDEEDAA